MSNRPTAAQVAGLDTNLTWIAYESDSADGLQVLHNGKAILTGSIESISVDIDSEKGSITAILVRKEGGSISLFPGSIEIVAKEKRISLSALETNNFDGLYFGLGVREDGTSDQVQGVKSLRIVLTPGLASAKLVWSEDGTDEAIF
jgi:hypothetical protein